MEFKGHFGCRYGKQISIDRFNQHSLIHPIHQVQIGKTEEDLLRNSGGASASVVKSVVSFPQGSQLQVRCLAQLLAIISSVSPKYSLIHVRDFVPGHGSWLPNAEFIEQENCFFLASLLQETLTDVFKGTLQGDRPTWARKQAPAPRLAVLERTSSLAPLRRVRQGFRHR